MFRQGSLAVHWLLQVGGWEGGGKFKHARFILLLPVHLKGNKYNCLIRPIQWLLNSLCDCECLRWKELRHRVARRRQQQHERGEKTEAILKEKHNMFPYLNSCWTFHLERPFVTGKWDKTAQSIQVKKSCSLFTCIQGYTITTFPGCVNMGWKICVLLPVVG